MSASSWAAVSAIAAAVATLASLAYTVIEARSAREQRTLARHELRSAFEDRLGALYPSLRAVLGDVEDDIDPAVRSAVVPMFVLYSHAWLAGEKGLYDDDNWDGLRAELGYWARKPPARDAWAQLRKQIDAWPTGFPAFIDTVMDDAGEPLAGSQPPRSKVAAPPSPETRQ